MAGPIRFGRYELHERLAIGGMGELFLARHDKAPRDLPPVVLKILLMEYRDNPDFRRMFHDEARIGMQLAHPNVVGVQEAGDVDGTPYIVLEYVDGENLRNVLRVLTDRMEKMPAEIAVRIGIDMLLGLDHAHRAKDEQGKPLNLVHRDLSPDNVILSWDGEVKILDFGIAKAEGRATRTQFGVLKGKGQYMAPEQALGLDVDARSDLYSVALVMLEAISGQKRFDNEDVVKQIVEARTWKPYGPSERDRSLPVELDAILLKALQVDPTRRWQTADEFAAALTRLLRAGSLPRTREALPALLKRAFPHRNPVREDDRPTTESKRPRKISDEEGTVPGMGPSTEEPTVLRPKPARPSAYREEPTASRDRAVNLAPRDGDGDDEEEATRAAELPMPRTPMPTEPPRPRNPVGSVDMASDPGWAKNAGAIPDEFQTAVTDRGAQQWTPDLPEENTGETAVPQRGNLPIARPKKRKKRGCFTRLLVLFVLFTGGVAATWFLRDRLPPEARARVESLKDVPQVQQVIAFAAEKGWLARLEPTPTPVDLVLSTANEVAMTSPLPEETLATTPTPEPTPTAVAIRSIVTPKPTPRVTAAAAKGASVKIVSTPPGHEILVDGRGTGKRTPATVIVAAGNHTLSIEAEGFKVWSFSEQLRDGDTLVLQANLVPR